MVVWQRLVKNDIGNWAQHYIYDNMSRNNDSTAKIVKEK